MASLEEYMSEVQQGRDLNDIVVGMVAKAAHLHDRTDGHMDVHNRQIDRLLRSASILATLHVAERLDKMLAYMVDRNG